MAHNLFQPAARRRPEFTARSASIRGWLAGRRRRRQSALPARRWRRCIAKQPGLRVICDNETPLRRADVVLAEGQQRAGGASRFTLARPQPATALGIKAV